MCTWYARGLKKCYWEFGLVGKRRHLLLAMKELFALWAKRQIENQRPQQKVCRKWISGRTLFRPSFLKTTMLMCRHKYVLSHHSCNDVCSNDKQSNTTTKRPVSTTLTGLVIYFRPGEIYRRHCWKRTDKTSGRKNLVCRMLRDKEMRQNRMRSISCVWRWFFLEELDQPSQGSRIPKKNGDGSQPNQKVKLAKKFTIKLYQLL